jgi:hypothetical protein
MGAMNDAPDNKSNGQRDGCDSNQAEVKPSSVDVA